MLRRLSLLWILGIMTGSTGAWAQCSDLFFSEYIEGSGSNKAVELFNPTSGTVALTDYKLLRYNNGSPTPTDSLFPQGLLGAGEVYVIGNASGNAAILAASDTLHSFTFYNGDDALAIVNMVTGDTLDIFGIIGQDPGTNWPVGTGATSEFTLVRMASVQEGTTDWALSATQWEVFPQNFTDSLGSHSMLPCGCTSDIFFSEYIEGSGSNKAVEVFNPLNDTVNLVNYKLLRYNNGSPTPTDSLFPQGLLAPQAVYVIGNASGNAAILAASDTLHSFTFYNGDDALAIVNMVTGDTLDIFGIIGQDPGTNWPVGTGATSEFTLVRMASVQEGTTDWALSATQWEVFPQNFTDSLGSHTMIPCGTVIPGVPEVSFAATAVSVNEFDGSASVTIVIANGGGDSVAVDVMLTASGTATNGLDFVWADTTVVFDSGSVAPIILTIPIIDDTDTEPDETFVLKLMNATNNAVLGMSDSVVVTILDNDALIPYYPIGLVSEDSDGDGLGDSLGVYCELRGVVYGIDMQGSANLISFTIIDPTGGIGIFSNQAPALGYTVLEGDSLHIFGTLNHFNGLFQISPDTINLISSGNALQPPTVVDSLGEYTESEFIRINGVYLANPAQWPGTGSNASVDIVVGNDTLVLRIDADTDIDGSPAPVGFFDVQGLGGQFDSSFPHNDGYQILPRFLTDIIPLPSPGFSFSPAVLSAGEGDGTVDFEVVLAAPQPDTVKVDVLFDVAASTATLGVDFDGWNDTTLTFAPGFTGPVALSLNLIDDTEVEADETIVLTLANPVGNAVLGDSIFTLTIIDNDYPIYPIGLVTADADGDGEADSVGVRCELRGVIYGVDLRTPGSGGIQVVMRDTSDGIQIFSFSYSFYAPVEGDSVHVQGVIDNFNGLAEIIPDTVIFISSGNALAEPVVVETLDESTENEFVMLRCLQVVDPSQWPAEGSNANVTFSNGVETFTIRIDKETEIDGSPVPTGWLDVIGLGAQFDPSYPYNDGYQLFPRYNSDFVSRPDPSVTFAEASENVPEVLDTLLIPIIVQDLNPDVTSFTVAVNVANSTATPDVDFIFADTLIETSGCGGPDTLQLAVVILEDTEVEGDETIELDITLNQNGAVGDIATYVITITGTDGIGNLLPAGAVRAFPNPTTGTLSLEASQRMTRVSLHDLTGRVLSQRVPQGMETQLDLATLPQGVYLLVVETAAGRWMQRIVKQ